MGDDNHRQTRIHVLINRFSFDSANTPFLSARLRRVDTTLINEEVHFLKVDVGA